MLPKPAHPVQSPTSKIIDEELAQLHPGLITHNIPDRMIQGKETYVVARIVSVPPGTADAVSQAEQALTKGLGKGAKPGENIQVSRTMKVELKGAEEDFHIEPQRLEEQIVDSAPPAEWAWIVTPKKFGSHRLTLSAVAVVKLAGTEKSKELAVFDHDVPIKISVGYLASEHWKEIGGAISGTGIIGWITARFQKRRKRRKQTPRAKGAESDH